MMASGVWDEVDAFLAEHSGLKMSFGLEYSSVVDWVADFTPRRDVPGSRAYGEWRVQATSRDEAIRKAMALTRERLAAADDRAKTIPAPALGQVWRYKATGVKGVVGKVLLETLSASTEAHDYVCERPHADGDFSYVCSFSHCKCQS
jgi:hypothetical protein